MSGNHCKDDSDCGFPFKLFKCIKKNKDVQGKVNLEDGKTGECVDISGYVPPPLGLTLELETQHNEPAVNGEDSSENSSESVRLGWPPAVIGVNGESVGLGRQGSGCNSIVREPPTWRQTPTTPKSDTPTSSSDTLFRRSLKCIGMMKGGRGARRGALKSNKSKNKSKHKSKNKSKHKSKNTKKKYKKRKRIAKKSKRRNR